MEPIITIVEAATSETSASRQAKLAVLNVRRTGDGLEMGRLIYEERKERHKLQNGDGMEAWITAAGVPLRTARRRVSQYEVHIGERTNPLDPVKDRPYGRTFTENKGLSKPDAWGGKEGEAFRAYLKEADWDHDPEPGKTCGGEVVDPSITISFPNFGGALIQTRNTAAICQYFLMQIKRQRLETLFKQVLSEVEYPDDMQLMWEYLMTNLFVKNPT